MADDVKVLEQVNKLLETSKDISATIAYQKKKLYNMNAKNRGIELQLTAALEAQAKIDFSWCISLSWKV